MFGIKSIQCSCSCFEKPTGIALRIPSMTNLNISGVSSSFLMDVFDAHMPHPISTPTAFGIITHSVAKTHPIGMPYHWCESGMTAIWDKAKGRLHRFLICSIAPFSMSSSHNFAGILPSSKVFIAEKVNS
jgi:hypothetical protein